MCLFVQKDSDAVKEALDQLGQVGWAKKWSSQPYVSRRTVSLQIHKCFQCSFICNLIHPSIFVYQTSLRELTSLGIKNAENLAIPSVRNDVSFSEVLYFLVSNATSSVLFNMQISHTWKCGNWLFLITNYP